ncbi:hypothetical protein COMNV_01745 [Commensalibacter sp. Nvir]|uniref:ABC transporter permease n=1 Tax=Commensalibacter sp. Nvir TaxID=3069817 RepID=UPI002D2B9FEB|nr:hypothetical protein COMNV_01745 [Commensalibacter sp. Nvir]
MTYYLIKAFRNRPNNLTLALMDIAESFRLWRLGLSLGWFDIKLRYKGSFFGPLWITSTSAAMIGTMGLIYSSLFNMDLHLYLPYISLAIILWDNAIAIYLTDGCFCFIQAEDVIHSVKMPFFIQVIRATTRNLIMLGLNLTIPLIVLLYYHLWPGWMILMCIPGILINIINGWAICLFLGCICARYRDIPQIINSLIQIIFYVTPIIWMPTQLHNKTALLLANPFYTMIEVIRAPLMGKFPSANVWGALCLYSIFIIAISFFVFVKKRSHLAFWI